jgi:molecular chaperone GrpE
VSQQETSSTVNEDAPELDEQASENAADTAAETSASKPAASPESSAELLTAQKQAQEYMAGWQRERAEFANYKKRAEREMKDIAQNAAVEAFMGLLPIMDDLERAMTGIPEDIKENAWVIGITAIQRKFLKILEDRGVMIIDPVGQVFDPSRHEAVATEDSSEVESGRVTVTLQKGYALGDRVLRPALVRVAN